MEIIRERANVQLCCRRVTKNHSDGNFHWHENCEICFPINKTMRIRVDGEIVKAGPGDIVVIEEQVVHQFLVDHDNTEICIIQLHPEILLGNLDRFGRPKGYIAREEIFAIEGLKERISALIELMLSEHSAEKAQSNPYFKSLAAAFYFLLYRHFGGDMYNGIESRHIFYTIVDYVNHNYCDDISVNSLAATFYFSRGKLSSLFRKYAGISITDYISILRIKKANAMLSNGSSVTEAAFESGFKNIRSFNNVYKKTMGMTPREYLAGEKKTEQ